MKFIDFEKIRNFSVYVTPNFSSTTTKRYKFSLLKTIFYVGIYTLISWIVLIIILTITPLKNSLFVIDNEEFQTQAKKVNDLQKKVVILTEGLQNLANANERIKFAVQLAQNDSLKKNDALYDTLQKTIKKKIKIGGDIYSAFIELYSKYFEEPDSTFEKFIFIEPVHGFINQSYNPKTGHLGIDYGVRKGTPVFASAGGLVTFADYTADFGYTIIIQHEIGYISLYKHCSELFRNTRDYVAQGELIALSGNSGRITTGPHLHFEIWQNGKPVDPQKLLLK